MNTTPGSKKRGRAIPQTCIIRCDKEIIVDTYPLIKYSDKFITLLEQFENGEKKVVKMGESDTNFSCLYDSGEEEDNLPIVTFPLKPEYHGLISTFIRSIGKRDQLSDMVNDNIDQNEFIGIYHLLRDFGKFEWASAQFLEECLKVINSSYLDNYNYECVLNLCIFFFGEIPRPMTGWNIERIYLDYRRRIVQLMWIKTQFLTEGDFEKLDQEVKMELMALPFFSLVRSENCTIPFIKEPRYKDNTILADYTYQEKNRRIRFHATSGIISGTVTLLDAKFDIVPNPGSIWDHTVSVKISASFVVRKDEEYISIRSIEMKTLGIISKSKRGGCLMACKTPPIEFGAFFLGDEDKMHQILVKLESETTIPTIITTEKVKIKNIIESNVEYSFYTGFSKYEIDVTLETETDVSFGIVAFAQV